MLETRMLVVAALIPLALAAGCANTVSQDPVAGIEPAVQGSGEISARAPADGGVYILDTAPQDVVYSAAICKGQLVAVDPVHNQISVDGELVSTAGLVTGHVNQIVFADSPPRQMVIRRTQTEPQDAYFNK